MKMEIKFNDGARSVVIEDVFSFRFTSDWLFVSSTVEDASNEFQHSYLSFRKDTVDSWYVWAKLDEKLPTNWEGPSW